MGRSLNKDRFESIINIVYHFLRWSVRALFVLLGITAFLTILFLFLPKGLFDYNTANLDHINIISGNILYDLRDAIVITGFVNVKWLLCLLFFVGSMNLGFFQYIQIQLKNIIADVREKKPFSDNNIIRLKSLGVAFLIASIALSILNGWLFATVVNTFSLFDTSAQFSIDFQSAFMGVIILILAYVFDYGAKLQEDVDMTV